MGEPFLRMCPLVGCCAPDRIWSASTFRSRSRRAGRDCRRALILGHVVVATTPAKRLVIPDRFHGV